MCCLAIKIAYLLVGIIIGGFINRYWCGVQLKKKKKEQAEFKRVTGFATPQEWEASEEAYEKGQELMMKFISEWKGERNSALGNLLFETMVNFIGNKDTIDNNSQLIVEDLKYRKYNEDNILDAITYGFWYRNASMNDGIDVPKGNKLQWLYWYTTAADEIKEKWRRDVLNPKVGQDKGDSL